MPEALAHLWSTAAAGELVTVDVVDPATAARVRAVVGAISRHGQPVVDGDWTGRRGADRRPVRLPIGEVVVDLAAGTAPGRYVRGLTVRARRSNP
jgi:hypothetical protein